MKTNPLLSTKSNSLSFNDTIRHMTGVSVVINAQDVESDLPRAIASVKNIADEIVVIDQDSADKTAEVAKKLGAKVYKHKRVDYVELARNFAIEKAKGPWILILDPDEEIPELLAKKILEVTQKNEADYYRIPRKNIIWGKWIRHTLWWPDYQNRLFKKGCVNWSEIIHSIPLTTGQGKEFPAKEENAILHHNYDYVEQFIERLNRYTSVQSGLLVKDGYQFVWNDIVSRPFKEFISRYFTGEGYKDGLHGFVLSLMQAFSELVTYTKIWQAKKFKEPEISVSDIVKEMSSKEKDLHFWENDALYKTSGNIGYRIKRKLKI